MNLNKYFSVLLLFAVTSLSALHAEIKVGTKVFYPPFVTSPASGFDIDLMKMICLRLKEECRFIPMNFNNIFSHLDQGKIDVAIGGISISLKRMEKYVFSTPYLVSKGQFLILKNSNINSVSELEGEEVGIIRGEDDGSAIYQILIKNYGSKFQIKQYNDVEDLISALSKQKITAAFIHRDAAIYWIENSGNQLQALGKPEVIGNGIGIIALPVNAPLIQRINEQLEAIEKDNSYLELYRIYLHSY
ncbi:transporter substrate-binding domain-containing protein [Legionella massiliensis]|nr:transporter substrate-binding domain-containing protein [Legionella massiliensis]